MIKKVINKFRAEGLRGVFKSAWKKYCGPAVHPVKIALDTLTEKPGFVVIQIGAFIGNTGNDPLFDSLRVQLKNAGGTLIVVEPVKCFFDQLVKNYEGVPGVIFENVAISEQSKKAAFYRLGVDPVACGKPAWLSQLGSLKEERMGELWDKYEDSPDLKAFFLEHRVKEEVDCLTFEELVDRHKIAKVDLLQIDTEGYELEILKSIDFKKRSVRFINFEHVLLHENKVTAEKLMQKNGYNLVDYQQDTFCFKKEDAGLAAKWCRFRADYK